MNAKDAKAIPLPLILERMGATVARERGQQCWYLSPLRSERTASFHVHTGKNVWYDFGDGRGGNVIDFVCAFLQSQGHSASVSNALSWLKDIPAASLPVAEYSGNPDEPGLILKKAGAIQHRALLQYLDTRGIALPVARMHLQQVTAVNIKTGKPFFALGFRNEDDGYELRNPYFKGCIAPKTVSFVRGATPKTPGIHVFEGMMDFLSVLTREQGKCLSNDALILNSLSCLSDALPYMRNYGYQMLFSWFDNDTAGRKALQTLDAFTKGEEGLVHLPMNKIYAGHKDVNEWHVQNRKEFSRCSQATPL